MGFGNIGAGTLLSQSGAGLNLAQSGAGIGPAAPSY